MFGAQLKATDPTVCFESERGCRQAGGSGLAFSTKLRFASKPSWPWASMRPLRSCQVASVRPAMRSSASG
jgi:hypothetical protein